MHILDNTSLPESADAYFSFYHTRAFDPDLDKNKPTVANMTDILGELEAAELRYSDRSFRINAMKIWIKLGIDRKVIESSKQKVIGSLF